MTAESHRCLGSRNVNLERRGVHERERLAQRNHKLRKDAHSQCQRESDQGREVVASNLRRRGRDPHRQAAARHADSFLPPLAQVDCEGSRLGRGARRRRERALDLCVQTLLLERNNQTARVTGTLELHAQKVMAFCVPKLLSPCRYQRPN